MKRGTIKAALIKEGGFGEHGRDERMTTVEKGAVNEKDAKDAVTDYAVVATGRRGVRLGGGQAAHRPHAPDPRASGRHRHADRRRLQIWRHAMCAARARSRTACICMPAPSISRVPTADGLLSTAPLPPHMLKTWKLLGFDPEHDDQSVREETKAQEMKTRPSFIKNWRETEYSGVPNAADVDHAAAFSNLERGDGPVASRRRPSAAAAGRAHRSARRDARRRGIRLRARRARPICGPTVISIA